MSWIVLIGAGLMEVLMVVALKNSDSFKNKKWTVIWFLLSMLSLFLLSVAIKSLPLGTAYSVWTGIGAMGSVIVGIVFYKDSFNLKKVILITLIIIAIVGLKLV
ncbi:QacE family quaternary ammonium compound efflux SMR transporter [Macrococcus brunensis]|uniref:QacE family quaternary ammonium compound efflux SMR transporter n=1 Tax=Macrococcus brunensis TaxID=198483 RepID=A0A4R6BEM9_9STAP|nr:SMR family transporter [Macrococcus brunensis]TDL98281.1 QacE family quaternary ammonium compound efflux SMR transporter [Macrococcus brunensis]ULG71578.1 SMR family transporter [Macrococcus brunensis]ULG73842.1 SMR family transporter [Macrococcus brunensis]